MKNFSLISLSTEQKELRKRILTVSHNSHLSHLGSCLSAVDLIDRIYAFKKEGEKFILSNGHAGIAWYVVLEKYGYIKDKSTIEKMHIHPDKNPTYDIHVSSGSLGQGLPIAVGIALADRNRKVYCMLSDGECAEGSIWESLRVAYEKKIHNLVIIINANGWSAYDKIDIPFLMKRIKAFGCEVKKINGHDCQAINKVLTGVNKKKLQVVFALTTVEQFPFLKGQDAHYYVMNERDYLTALTLLK